MRPEETLLRICAGPDNDFTAAFSALTDAGWIALVDLATQKRIAPLLFRAIDRAGLTGILPTSCAEALDEQLRFQKMSAFGHMIALIKASELLRRSGIGSIALKGARLAFADYPESHLRPLRDIDLLVARDVAEQTQQLLIDSKDYAVASWAEHYGIDYGHQLPELLDVRHGVSFEIHHRLNARGWQQEPELVRKMHAEPVEIKLGQTAVQVPSIHCNLLHLIEHATLHHMFENGPLILSDLHFTAATGQIDWPELLNDARKLGLERSLLLVAALARQYGATWIPDELAASCQQVSAVHLAVAETAILRDEEVSEHHHFLRNISIRLGEQPRYLTALRAALSPNPLRLAGMLRLQGTNPLRWLAYPVWLCQRALTYFTARRAISEADDTEKEVATLRWLHSS